jgi:hypothetical protein
MTDRQVADAQLAGEGKRRSALALPILSLLSPFGVIGLIVVLAQPPRHLEDVGWILGVGVLAAVLSGGLGLFSAWRSRSLLGRVLALLGALLSLGLVAWGSWAIAQ